MIPILNALNVHVAVFGNHDFGKCQMQVFSFLYSVLLIDVSILYRKMSNDRFLKCLNNIQRVDAPMRLLLREVENRSITGAGSFWEPVK